MKIVVFGAGAIGGYLGEGVRQMVRDQLAQGKRLARPQKR